MGQQTVNLKLAFFVKNFKLAYTESSATMKDTWSLHVVYLNMGLTFVNMQIKDFLLD
jgi:hypothetical protein